MILEEIPNLTKLLNLKENPPIKNAKELKLYKALERLVAGESTHPKNKPGILSYSAIYREAGASNGTVASYPIFKEIAKQAIANYKVQVQTDEELTEVAQALADVEALKQDVKHEGRLKDKYRNELALQVSANNILVQREAEILFSLYEKQCELHDMKHNNVISFK